MNANHCDLHDNDCGFDEAVTAYLKAVDAGQSPDPQLWLRRYPEVASELADFFAGQEEIERLTAPLRNVAGIGTPAQCDIQSPAEIPRVTDALRATSLADDTADDTAVVTPAKPPIACHFGDYDLLQEIGRGGMGIVYRASHTKLNRTVALKMIRAGQFASTGDVQRFQSEAEAAASLDHPHIVPIYEVGQHAGQHYFTMKLIDGGSLAEAGFRDRSLGVNRDEQRQVAELVATVARAVHYAHLRGILHRDLKPSNILVDQSSQPYVTDFGLAKRVEGESSLTVSGAIVGTPLYMAPEQASGQKRLTTAADTYSLGAILYWLLTGKPAFQAATPVETLRQVQEQEPVSPCMLNPLVDRDLETICLKCLEKAPQRRYASAAALADDLDRWLANEPILARPLTRPERLYRWAQRQPAIAGLTLAILLIAALGLFGILTQWQTALASEQEATRQRDEVKSVNEKLQRMLYASDMNHTKLAWDAGAIDRALELLQQHRPKPEEPDPRGFEWYYLHRLCHSNVMSANVGRIVGNVAFSPDGKRFAAQTQLRPSNRVMQVWDTSSGAVLLTLGGKSESGRLCVAFSSDGKRLATGSRSSGFDAAATQRATGDVKLWDAQTGQEVLAIRDEGEIASLAFSPDGTHLAGATSDQTVNVWDTQTGQQLRSLRHTGPVSCVAYRPDGEQLAVGVGESGKAGEVIIWDAKSGSELRSLKVHLEGVLSIAFSPDGRLLASRSRDDYIKIWDVQIGRDLLTMHGRAADHGAVAFSPDGNRLASSTNEGVTIWDARTGIENITLKRMHPFEMLGTASGVAFSPDGKRLLSVGGRAGRFNVWDSEISEATSIHDEHARGEDAQSVVFSNDGRRIARTNGDLVSIWDVSSRQEVLTLNHPEVITAAPSWGGMSALRFSPDDKLVATAGWRGEQKDKDNNWQDLGCETKIWDTITGRLVHDFSGKTAGGGPVAFSPDGKRFAAAAWDEDVIARLWDLVPGNELLSLKRVNTFPRALAFHADGKRLSAVWTKRNDASSFRLMTWDASTGNEISNVELPGASFSNHVAFSPDGERLACTPGESVRIYHAKTGAETLHIRAPTAAIHVAFSPDGTRLVSAGRDGTITIWDSLGGQELLRLNGGYESRLHLSFSSDGRQLAVGSSEGIRILDATPVAEPTRGQPVAARTDPIIWAEGHNVYTAEIDLEKEQLVSPPVEAMRRDRGNNWAPAWSRDGKFLACLSFPRNDRPFFYFRSVESQETRELKPNLTSFNVHALHWSPDGRGLIALAQEESQWKVVQVDVATGGVTTLIDDPAMFVPRMFPDGKSLFYAQVSNKGRRLVRRDIATGVELELYDAAEAWPWNAISPDGKQLAFAESGAVKVLSTTGGEPRELQRRDEGISTIAWTPDGKNLLVQRWNTPSASPWGNKPEGGRKAGLWRIPVDGGQPRMLDIDLPPLQHLRIHPDGRQITFRAE